MNTTFSRKGALRAILVAAALSIAAACQSAETRTIPAEREQMAALHEQAARCLRSDQPMEKCHEEMRKGCESIKGAGCSMMDMSRMYGAMGNKDANGAGKDTQHQH